MLQYIDAAILSPLFWQTCQLILLFYNSYQTIQLERKCNTYLIKYLVANSHHMHFQKIYTELCDFITEKHNKDDSSDAYKELYALIEKQKEPQKND